MQALQGELLLAAWERCQNRPSPVIALGLLESAHRGTDRTAFAQLPLTRIHAMLLQLRAVTFGRRMQGFAECPNCHSSLEFETDVVGMAEELRRSASQENSLAESTIFRPVNLDDLQACLDAESPGEASNMLLQRTLLDASSTDHKKEESLLLFDGLNEASEIWIDMHCPQCGQDSAFDLDITQFLWREVRAAATRLLADVHLLASRYGWSEESILSMSHQRRFAYLEMLTQ